MFDVITLLYIYLPSWPDINTSCTVVACEGYSVYIVERCVPKPGHPCANTLPVISVTNLTPMYNPNADLKSTPDGPTCQYHPHDSKTSSATPATQMLQQSANFVQPKDYRYLLKNAPFCPFRTSWNQFTPPHVCLMRSFLILWPHSLFGSDNWVVLVLLAADRGLCSTQLPILLTGHDLSYTTKANLWYGRQPQMIN